MTIDPKRLDLETAVLLLVGKACERALAKEKNRAKGCDVPDLTGCLRMVRDEVAEAWLAESTEDVIDELGDIIASSGIALWRAHGGGGE